MADPFDIANLWWLQPPKAQSSSSLPAFELGAKMQQDRIENDLKAKRMMLDQQYRMENLKAQERWTDARIQNYESLAQQRRDEEDDMEKATEGMGEMAKGNLDWQPSTPFKTEKGPRALRQFRDSIIREKHLQNLRGQTREQQGKYLERLGRLKDLEPQEFADIANGFKQTGEFTPEAIGRIESLLKKHSIPSNALAPGQVLKRQWTVLPDGTRIETGPEITNRTERLAKPERDIAVQEYARRRAAITKQNAGRRPGDRDYNPESEEQSWEKAIQHAERAAQLPRPGMGPQQYEPEPGSAPPALKPAFRFDPKTKKLIRIE